MTRYDIHRSGEREHKIALIDGPNMSNLGRRNKQLYGDISSLSDLQDYVVQYGQRLGVSVETFASNHEGEILEYIHEAGDRVDAFIINPAGLTTKGEGVRHALEDTTRPVVEVHFANTQAAAGAARGLGGGAIQSSFTHTATGLCMGLRHYSYIAALTALVHALDDTSFLGNQDG